MSTSDPIKKVTLRSGKTRYRFIIDVGRKPDGRRDQRTYTFDTRKEAKAEYARIKHETDRGTYVKPGKITVDEFLDEWLTSATRDVEKATAANYRDALLPVRIRIGGKPLQDITEADIEALIDWMLAEGRRRGGKPGMGLGVRSVRLTLGRLRTALNVAVRRQLVVRNVAAFVTIPRAAAKAAADARAERKPWTQEEVKAFLTGITGERLYAPCLLSLMGLRPAEVCGLRWSDIDFEAGTIAAGENTRTLVDGEIEEKEAKSAAGKRGLPMPATVAKALKAFHTLQKKERLKAGDVYVDSGYVLVNELGQPQRTDWLRRRVYELVAKVGVRKVRPYDARHVAVALAALGDGCDRAELAAALGVATDDSDLAGALRQLAGVAVAWPDGDRLRTIPLGQVWPCPLGLGAVGSKTRSCPLNWRSAFSGDHRLPSTRARSREHLLWIERVHLSVQTRPRRRASV